MRRSLFVIAGAVLSCILICVSDAWSLEVSSKRLIEYAKFYDGKVVTYKGEAVTAIMKRGEYGWVNINDGDNAIGVWCKASALDTIKFLGGYKTRGDIVEIVGVFNRECQEHGGDLDIHADTLSVKRTGYQFTEKVDPGRIRLIALFFIATMLIAVVFRKRI